MKILIDECIDERLRLLFAIHECKSARYAGLGGLKIGDLLTAAEAAGFDVIVTTDQSIPYQQNLAGRTIALLILSAPTNRFRDLQKLIPATLAALDSIAPGAVVRVP